MKSSKKNLMITLGAILMVVTIGITYAFITQVLTGTKEVVINAGVLDLVLEEENEITISDALPVYDEVGMIQEDAFIFRLVNKTANKTDYILKLNDITTGDKLDTSIVKYGLTKENEKTINLLSGLTNGVIDKGTINGNDTIDYTLRLWIDSEVTDDSRISGKSLSYRIEVEVSQPQPYQVRYGELYSATIDGVQGGFIFNEDGSALMYGDYVQQEQFEAGTFAFAGENIISSIGIDFKISEDGTELYLGEDSEQINLNLIEKGGDILFGKSYSITVDGATTTITFNNDGSLFMNAPDGVQTAPAGTAYYRDGGIYDSVSNELMGYTMDNGNMISFQGMLLKYTYVNPGTVKIHDDEYAIDGYKIISDELGIQYRFYNVTDVIYTKEDLLNSYIVFQAENTGFVDAFYLSSDFIDKQTNENGNIIIYSTSNIMGFSSFGAIFLQNDVIYEGTILEKGFYLFVIDILLDESSFHPFNVIISKNIDNPILLDVPANSEAESYDIDLTDTEKLLYHVSDDFIAIDLLVGSSIMEQHADGTDGILITSDKITQISENVYILSGTYNRYFVKEDTYLDSDGDGFNDKYYKKGIYVDIENDPYPGFATEMKIVKYQP